MKRKGASCDKCPLRDRPYVPSEYPPSKVRMAFVGEAPGAEEERTHKPFVGPAGSWLMSAMSEVPILRSGVYLGNVLCCRPTDNDIDLDESKTAIECCKGGLYLELATLKPDVIIPLGNTALSALYENTFGITKMRGSVLLWREIPMIPTFHPSAIMRSQERVPIRDGIQLSAQILRPVWISDMKKAKSIATGGWSPPKEHFNVYPTVNDVVTLMRRLDKNVPLAIDIETSGEALFTIAIAWSENDAICIPYRKKGGDAYWNDFDFPVIKSCIRYLLENHPTVYQNAKFDVSYLKEAGYRINNIQDDTMLLHHAIIPEFPHDLGFIVSQYGLTPYWKGDMNFSDMSIYEREDPDVRVYNCRDAVVLLQILSGLLKDLHALGEKAEYVYRNITMKMIRPVMDMEKQGMLVSPSRLLKFKEDLKNDLQETETRIYETFRLPKQFNLDSNDDIAYLLFGKIAPKYEKARTLLPTKKKTNTKVYATMAGLVEILQLVPPFYVSSHAKGSSSVADDTLLTILRSVASRSDLIDRFKRPTQEHSDEKKQLARCQDFIRKFQKRNELSKLISTYTVFPVDKGNRIHPSYLQHGTATGRLSAKQPNIQNQPEAIRKIFIAREDHEYVSADYSNLELRVLAVVANDKKMLEIFESGASIHDVLTMELFGVAPEDPRFKVFKRAEKTFIFGRNYGGTRKGIYERVLRQVPECNLSFARFCAVDDVFRKKFRGVEVWTQQTKERVSTTRTLQNCFGRIRVFFGSEYDILKEGLNFPIQSAAADIINQATIGIWEKGISPICQVHDQLLFEVPTDEVEKTSKLVKSEMEREFTINANTIKFPVELSRGRSWGELTTFAV